jgi:cyclophilin family peptidyl-prolyl cis-trans isomerase
MYKYLFVILVIFFFISCTSNPKVEKQQAVSKPNTVKPNKPSTKSTIKKKEKVVRFNISDENVVKKLSSYGENHGETIILMKTSKGNMKIKLYKETPLHRANFIMLAKNKFYENTVFYRVIKNFMIQGGDSDADDRKEKKQQFGRYTIPTEFNNKYIHKKGALSMTREYEDNPEKRSVSFDFFLVQGEIYSEGQLKAVEMETGNQYTPEQRNIYKTIGGTPHLDNEHTVFGEVLDGIEVIDSIANSRVDESNWPRTDVKINIEIIK